MGCVCPPCLGFFYHGHLPVLVFLMMDMGRGGVEGGEGSPPRLCLNLTMRHVMALTPLIHQPHV